MIKALIIAAYVAHKIWWKYSHREIVVSWQDFFENI
jgi:hypothetical protein